MAGLPVYKPNVILNRFDKHRSITELVQRRKATHPNKSDIICVLGTKSYREDPVNKRTSDGRLRQ